MGGDRLVLPSPFGTGSKDGVLLFDGGSGAGLPRRRRDRHPGLGPRRRLAFAGTDEPVTSSQLANARRGSERRRRR